MNKILDILKTTRIVEKDNTYSKENAENISRFLNRLLALEIKDQELMFKELDTIMTTIIEHAKEEGSYDSGLEDLPISNISFLEKETIGSFTIHKISGTQLANKTPFDVVQKRLEKLTGSVYQCNETKTIFLARDPFNTYYFGSYERVYRLSSPIDYRHKTESLKNLYNEYLYTRLKDIDQIQSLWEQQYDQAPRELTKEFYILTGSILDQWKIIKSNLQKVNIVRVGTGKDRIVGVLINKETADSLIGAKSSGHAKEKIYNDLFTKREYIVLHSFNMRLFARKIYGEPVITIAPHKGSQESMNIGFIPNQYLKYLMYNNKLVTFIQKEYTDDFIALVSLHYLADIGRTEENQQKQPTEHKPLDLRAFRTQRHPQPQPQPQPTPTDTTTTPKEVPTPVFATKVFGEQLSLF